MVPEGMGQDTGTVNGKGSKQRPSTLSHAELQKRWEQVFPVMDHRRVCYGKGCPCTYTEHHACGCTENYRDGVRTDDRCPHHKAA